MARAVLDATLMYEFTEPVFFMMERDLLPLGDACILSVPETVLVIGLKLLRCVGG